MRPGEGQQEIKGPTHWRWSFVSPEFLIRRVSRQIVHLFWYLNSSQARGQKRRASNCTFCHQHRGEERWVCEEIRSHDRRDPLHLIWSSESLRMRRGSVQSANCESGKQHLVSTAHVHTELCRGRIHKHMISNALRKHTWINRDHIQHSRYFSLLESNHCNRLSKTQTPMSLFFKLTGQLQFYIL